MKRHIAFVCSVLLVLGTLSACGEDEGSSRGRRPESAEPTETEGTVANVTEAASEPTNAPDIHVSNPDVSTDESLREFITGAWYFADRNDGKDYARIVFAEDGTCTFERLSDKLSCSGKIAFKNLYSDPGDAPDGFEISFDNIPNGFLPKGSSSMAVDQDSTGGVFHIGQAAGTDYLYLEEIGNGDTFISNFLFANDPEPDPWMNTDWSRYWVLHRDNSLSEDDPVKNESFYAMIWKQDGDSVSYQRMEEQTFPTEDEYTGRPFTGAYFSGKEGQMIRNATLSDALDIGGMYDTKRWEKTYPAEIYEVQTDANGEIISLVEVDPAPYGIYDLGDLEPSCSVDGMIFHYNDYEFDLSQWETPANAIMDYYRQGDWIVVEGHINPDTSAYFLYNMNSGEWEEPVCGGTLYFDKDARLGVYSFRNEVYDMEGHVQCGVDGTEIISLEPNQDGSGLVITYIDENGKEYSVEMDMPAEDNLPMYRYEDFCKHGMRSNWREFWEKAPEDALAMVVVNPRESLSWIFTPAEEIEKGGLDTVLVVALQDDITLAFDEGTPSYQNGQISGMDEVTSYGENYHLENRGDAMLFEITVPEGIPSDYLIVTPAVGACGGWEVGQISGKLPIHCAFITAP
ncbi:MAG: hypothetical protein IKQ27_00925 [Lachnospiraceae bacterium]|nr:hypothetical protein [Lachnospiraceae bacterium]